jgi:hypothetical protein
MHLNKDRREKVGHAPKAVEAVNLGFATDCNTSEYKLYIEETGKILISNQGYQVKFDENLYPSQNSYIVSQYLHDITVVDVMSLDTGEYNWIHFTPKIDLGGFEKIHSGGSSDSYILHSISGPKVHMGVKREEFFKSLLNKRADELLTGARVFEAKNMRREQSHPAAGSRAYQGISTLNNPPNKAAQELRDAMSREGQQKWVEAYDAEHQGFNEHQILSIARPEPTS